MVGAGAGVEVLVDVDVVEVVDEVVDDEDVGELEEELLAWVVVMDEEEERKVVIDGVAVAAAATTWTEETVRHELDFAAGCADGVGFWPWYHVDVP